MTKRQPPAGLPCVPGMRNTKGRNLEREREKSGAPKLREGLQTFRTLKERDEKEEEEFPTRNQKITISSF